MVRARLELGTSRFQVWRSNHSATLPPFKTRGKNQTDQTDISVTGPGQPCFSYEHIEFFTKERVARRGFGNRASPVDRAHMKRPYTTSAISKLFHIISRFVRRVKFAAILKYHEWYLCQISRTIHAITFYYINTSEIPNQLAFKGAIYYVTITAVIS